MSSVLTTKIQLANYVKANYPNIPYFGVFDLTSTTDLAWDAADAAGCVTLVVGNTVGENLSAGEKSSLLADLQTRCVAGLTITLADFSKVDMTVQCDIAILTGYSSLEVRTAVDEQLTNLLSYAGYNFNGSVIKNELISFVATIPGVKYVSDITFSSSDPEVIIASGVTTLVNKNSIPNADVTVSVV